MLNKEEGRGENLLWATVGGSDVAPSCSQFMRGAAG